MQLSRADVDRIIQMAWEDRTSFEAIRIQFGLGPKEVIELMRREMKPSSFRMWRKRTQGRFTKHERLFQDKLLDSGLRRFRAQGQGKYPRP